MKKILLGLVIMLGPALLYSQDIMIKTNGTEQPVKIIEIGEDLIRYKPFVNQDGPMFTIRISSVHKVILENGEVYEFSPLLNTNSAESEKSATKTDVQNITTKQAAAVSSSTSQNTNPDTKKANDYNIRKLNVSLFNFDLSNTENPGSSDDEETIILVADILSFNMLYPLGGSDSDSDINSSHGIVLQTTLKYRHVDPPLSSPIIISDTYIVDIGVGYGYNIKKDLRLYGTLNTAMYFSTTTSFFDAEDISDSDSFPEDSGSLRLGAYWTPIQFGNGSFFGFHAAFDSYFAEGAENGFLVGISFK